LASAGPTRRGSVADLRPRRGDRQIAAEHQLQAPREGEAVDRGDRRQRQRLEPPHRRADRLQKALEGTRLGPGAVDQIEVGAGAEGPPGTSEDQRPHLLVGERLLHRRLEPGEDLVVQAVQRLGSVQPRPEGRAAPLERDRAHPPTLRSRPSQ
jgi:hypothetical protein